MIRASVFALALMTSVASAQNAPFCVVDAGGTSCFYYNRSACVRAAGENGACVVNSNNSGRQSQITTPDSWGAFNQGVESGRRARQARERSEQTPSAFATFCDRMLSHDIAMLEELAPRLTTEEYAAATTSYVNRATYCRSLVN